MKSKPFVVINCDGHGCKKEIDVPDSQLDSTLLFNSKEHRYLNKHGWSFVENHYCPSCTEKKDTTTVT